MRLVQESLLVGVGEQRAQRRLGSSYGRGLLSPSEFGDEVRADVARVNGRLPSSRAALNSSTRFLSVNERFGASGVAPRSYDGLRSHLRHGGVVHLNVITQGDMADFLDDVAAVLPRPC